MCDFFWFGRFLSDFSAKLGNPDKVWSWLQGDVVEVGRIFGVK